MKGLLERLEGWRTLIVLSPILYALAVRTLFLGADAFIDALVQWAIILAAFGGAYGVSKVGDRYAIGSRSRGGRSDEEPPGY